MGVYIYSIRAKKITFAMPDGQIEDAHFFRYLTKPHSWGEGEDRGTKLLKGRCDSYWRRKGGPPKYIVCPSGEGKTPKVRGGDSVYRWDSEDYAWDYDTPCFKRATLIGWTKVTGPGTTYSLHNETFNCDMGIMHGNCLHATGTLRFPSRGQADSFIRKANQDGLHVRMYHSWINDEDPETESHEALMNQVTATLRWGQVKVECSEHPVPPPVCGSLLDVDPEAISRLAAEGDKEAQVILDRIKARQGV